MATIEKQGGDLRISDDKGNTVVVPARDADLFLVTAREVARPVLEIDGSGVVAELAELVGAVPPDRLAIAGACAKLVGML